MKKERNKRKKLLSVPAGISLVMAGCLVASAASPLISNIRAEDFAETGQGFDQGNFDDPAASTQASAPAQAPAPAQTPSTENVPAAAGDGQALESGLYMADPQTPADDWAEEESVVLGDIINHRKSEITLNGIDISNWQKTIDVNAINADFIIAKATGGNGFYDPSFERFAQDTLNSGRLFGFYHYANDRGHVGTPEEEARFFYEKTEKYVGLGIPILDYEDPDLLKSGTDWAKRFLDTYYQLSGVKAMVYTSSHWTRTLDWSQIAAAGHVLWVANYGKNEEQPGYRETAEVKTDQLGTGAFTEYYMHQYTSRGKLDGYSGNLDLNKFYGTPQDWMELTLPANEYTPMFRLYNYYSGEHFYTASKEERRILIDTGWKDESVAWIAPKAGKNVYRLFNPNAGDHHYTMSVEERDALIAAGWNYEGVGWLSESENKGLPIYRAYNPNATTGTHHYTMDINEINTLVDMGWVNEGIAWYGVDRNYIESDQEKAEREFAEVQQTLRPFKNAQKF